MILAGSPRLSDDYCDYTYMSVCLSVACVLYLLQYVDSQLNRRTHISYLCITHTYVLIVTIKKTLYNIKNIIKFSYQISIFKLKYILYLYLKGTKIICELQLSALVRELQPKVCNTFICHL